MAGARTVVIDWPGIGTLPEGHQPQTNVIMILSIFCVFAFLMFP